MQNLLTVLTFSVLEREHSFWANFIQNIKWFILSVLDWNYPFWINLFKKSNLSV